MRGHPQPSFEEPLTSSFVYAAWSVDPRRVGPFVRPSAARTDWIDKVRGFARQLTQRTDIEAVRVFEASFIPPLPGMPKYDVVMLVRVRNRQGAAAVRDDPQLRALAPATLFAAGNAARFGDTEATTSGANILLNHFTGPPDRSAAADCWCQISSWYAAKTGVDNSTLLRTDDDAPYVIVNYARIPGGVVPFMLQMLLRPSFYREVRATLKQRGLTSLPLFVRNLPVGVADA